MKTFRIWLLLLLAVLLPVRGAMAVAMHCQGAGSPVQADARLVEHAHGPVHRQAATDGHGHQHDAAAHDHGGAHAPDGAGHAHAGAADKCNLCSASCSATGLVSRPLAFAGPQTASAVVAHLDAASPSFVPDGQERPPRSI